MDNHEKQFGGFYLGSAEMNEDRKVMNDKKLPENLQVTTHYAEKSLHDTSDERIKFNDTSANFYFPFEDEELLSGRVKPKSAGTRQMNTELEFNNRSQNHKFKDGHNVKPNSDVMAGGGKPKKTETPDGLLSDFNKMLMLSGIMLIVIFLEAVLMFAVL